MSWDRPPRIVTDSATDIPGELARRLDITVIPCQIHLQGRTYLEGIDITGPELFQRMRSGAAALTSQPAVGVFARTYEQALQEGRPVVAIHLGSGFSGLHDTACIAAREVDPERVTIVDSQQVSMGAGWLAILAAEMAQQGQPATQILAAIRGLVPRLRLFALIDDLRALRRGGRVGWVSSLVGQWLAIKPIVLVQGNRAEPTQKVRSFSRGLDRLVALGRELGPIERLAILHADAPRGVAQLGERFAAVVPAERTITAEAGAIIGAHAGPGAVGFAVVLKGQAG